MTFVELRDLIDKRNKIQSEIQEKEKELDKVCEAIFDTDLFTVRLSDFNASLSSHFKDRHNASAEIYIGYPTFVQNGIDHCTPTLYIKGTNFSQQFPLSRTELIVQSDSDSPKINLLNLFIGMKEKTAGYRGLLANYPYAYEIFMSALEDAHRSQTMKDIGLIRQMIAKRNEIISDLQEEISKQSKDEKTSAINKEEIRSLKLLNDYDSEELTRLQKKLDSLGPESPQSTTD